MSDDPSQRSWNGQRLVSGELRFRLSHHSKRLLSRGADVSVLGVYVSSTSLASRLHLNLAKTQIIWLGSRQQLQKVEVNDISILATTMRVTDTARDLGIVIDSQLSLEAHVSAVRRSGFYQIRQLRPVIRSMPQEAAKMLGHAFISSRLDYCNSLRYGITDGLLQKLQSVQNAAARLVTGARRRDHITPVLHDLHWLPVWQRIACKIACLVFQWLSGQAPEYLINDCRLLLVHEDHLIPEYVVFHGRTTVLGTAAFPLPVHTCGTIFPRTFDKPIWVTNISNGSWKLICLEITAHCDFFYLRL